MNTSNPDSASEGEPTGFDSRDTVIVICDGPGDNTIRPPRPLVLKLGLAERERLARYEELRKQAESAGKAPIAPQTDKHEQRADWK